MGGTATFGTNPGRPTNGANPWIDSLIWGDARWIDDPTVSTPDGSTTITWARVSGTDPYGTVSANNRAWTGAYLDALRQGFASWAAVANIVFVESSLATPTPNNEVDIWAWQTSAANLGGALGDAEIPEFGVAGLIEPLYIRFNREDTTWINGIQKGGDGFSTVVHEIGHVLGLAHPHDGGARPDGNIFPGVTAEFDSYGDHNLNQGIFTVMSYNGSWPVQFPSHTNVSYGYSAGPMALDIAAIQAIYGANMNAATGNDVYTLAKVNAVGTFWSSIWDAGGTDTISNAGATTASTIDLRAAPLKGPNAGGYISWNAGIVGGFTIANGVVIENAIGGSGNDTIVGNEVANQIDGGAGADTMWGSEGDDTYFADNIGDLVQAESDIGGIDIINFTGASGTYVLPAFVERLNLLGSSAINGTGNEGINTITGNSAANTLDGRFGRDTLIGGNGDDTYIQSGGELDQIIETLNGGDDQVIFTDYFLNGYTLEANIERLTILGGHGAGGKGNELANIIKGDESLNWIDGGAGIDTMIGGNGVDYYTADEVGDIVIELNGIAGGEDRIDFIGTSGTYVLPANVEDLQLLGTSNTNGTGNEAANRLDGNSGNNILIGGSGDDLLLGGAGDDSLFGGSDTDQLQGNDGNDRLDGGNDNIVDYLYGGNGDDVYVANGSVADKMVDDSGNDTILSASTFNLADTNVFGIENLTLTGSAAANGTGNGLANVLIGNSGVNRLSGLESDDWLDGGAGADTLLGGLGNDTLIFDVLDLPANINGGDGTDTLRIVGGNLPGSLNLLASSLERAMHLETDTTNQIWTNRTSTYDQEWSLQQQDIFFDNGTSRYTSYDNGPGQIWQSLRQDYNTAGAMTYQYYVFDNGTSRDNGFDTANANVWSSLRQDYNTAGVMTYQYYVFDNGTSRDNGFDTANANVWSSLRQDYNTAGAMTYQYYVFDNGTARDNSFDTANANVWSSLRQDYNGGGAMTYQYYVFDNGTSRQVVNDIADVYTWSTQTTNYDAGGNAIDIFYV